MKVDTQVSISQYCQVQSWYVQEDNRTTGRATRRTDAATGPQGGTSYRWPARSPPPPPMTVRT